ncbi:hypothetical protein BHYA_0001g00200 [Botrytis hyacinthi]|uniref:Uncharacterized protein n=1 Tax=Botrytis hyacinthi TaxID=278943 RepID=A0A4Z1H5R1_9HELO|nr:hypothetical protein BHYA_0001g00200 [Botrytis hyacinthi]
MKQQTSSKPYQPDVELGILCIQGSKSKTCNLMLSITTSGVTKHEPESRNSIVNQVLNMGRRIQCPKWQDSSRPEDFQPELLKESQGMDFEIL